MRKTITLFLFVFVSLCCHSFTVCDNFSIDGELAFNTKEIWRGTLLAKDGASLDVDFSIGNDSVYGTLTANGWITVNRGCEMSNYREVDARLSYSVPGDYFTVHALYCCYMGMYDNDCGDAYFGFDVGGGKDLPLRLSYDVQFYGNDTETMHVLLQYNADVDDFSFNPMVGWHIYDMSNRDYYFYVQLDCYYAYALTEWLDLNFKVGTSVNFYDCKSFQYDKNANVYCGVGLSF